MNEEIKENGIAEEKKKFKSSWPKAFSWVAFALSVIVPVVSIGLSIICISQATEEEKNEVSIICGISLVIAIVLFVNGVLCGSPVV